MELSIEELKKENDQLKNRCYVTTKGLLCMFCPFECEHRSKMCEEGTNDND